jgi:uncharacterized protein
MEIQRTMSEQIGRWDELEQALLALGDRVMVLEEFDGFVAGLLVCPELIRGGDWIAAAFGFGGGQSPFTDIDHANAILGLVQDYYNSVVVTLMDNPEDYCPLIPIDEQSGEVIWELWIDGFAAAVDLRPEAWQTLLQGEGEPAIAMAGMMMLIEAARGEEPDPEKSAALGKAAPTMIPEWVVTLHEHRLATYEPPSFAAQPNPFVGTPKAGRNDPCPCGSGRKYKRCCGAN